MVIKSENKQVVIEQLLLEAKAVALSPKKPFTYASGKKGPIYCDNRILISIPEIREQIIAAMLQIIKEKNISFTTIAGTATAGIPWASFLADRLKKPMVYVRDKKKDHGKQNQIEGRLKENEQVILIEDTINFGSSTIAAVHALIESGARVEHCIAIYSHEHASAHQQYQEKNCTLHVLAGFKKLIEIAEQQHYISAEERKIVETWHNNPDQWEKNYANLS